MRKLYTDEDYFRMANEANMQGKKLVKVQEEIDVAYEVYEYDEQGKPIMVEETIINPITGEEETILVHKHHTEYRKELVERLEIQDNPENFQRQFFNTSLGYVRRKPYVKGTGEYKDFLSDIVSGLKVGDTVLTYTAEGKQQIVTVTEQFIAECVHQYNLDFYGA